NAWTTPASKQWLKAKQRCLKTLFPCRKVLAWGGSLRCFKGAEAAAYDAWFRAHVGPAEVGREDCSEDERSTSSTPRMLKPSIIHGQRHVQKLFKARIVIRF